MVLTNGSKLELLKRKVGTKNVSTKCFIEKHQPEGRLARLSICQSARFDWSFRERFGWVPRTESVRKSSRFFRVESDFSRDECVCDDHNVRSQCAITLCDHNSGPPKTEIAG